MSRYYLDDILDKEYIVVVQKKRRQWEEEVEAFRIGVLLEEARIKMGMTQQELAEKYKHQ